MMLEKKYTEVKERLKICKYLLHFHHVENCRTLDTYDCFHNHICMICSLSSVSPAFLDGQIVKQTDTCTTPLKKSIIEPLWDGFKSSSCKSIDQVGSHYVAVCRNAAYVTDSLCIVQSCKIVMP